MPDIRKIRNKARRDLHVAMQVPAHYYEKDVANGFRVITVRIHNKPEQVGDIQGTGFNYATMQDTAVKAVFLRDELSPIRNAIISVAPEEAYAVDNVQPPNGITVTAEVKRLSAKDCAELSYPDPDA
jgi:hypothetical protein